MAPSFREAGTSPPPAHPIISLLSRCCQASAQITRLLPISLEGDRFRATVQGGDCTDPHTSWGCPLAFSSKCYVPCWELVVVDPVRVTTRDIPQHTPATCHFLS